MKGKTYRDDLQVRRERLCSDRNWRSECLQLRRHLVV